MVDFIDAAIADAGVTMAVKPLDDNAFKCEMTSAHAKMSRTIKMAEGYGPPVLGNLVYYYATEIQLYEDCDDILEWAADMGVDPGDALTLKRYSQIGIDQRDLSLLLGEENYQNMIAALEISQAIENAEPE